MTRSKMGDKWQAAASSQEPEQPLQTNPRHFIYSDEQANTLKSFYEELGRQIQAGLYTGAPFALRPAANNGVSSFKATVEQQCYELSGRRDDFCSKCAVHLVAAGVSVKNLTGLDAPCYICDMKSGKPEAFTTPFCEFLTENPTIFHAVDYFKGKLNGAGFTEVRRYVELKGSVKQLANFVFNSYPRATTGPKRSYPAESTT